MDTLPAFDENEFVMDSSAQARQAMDNRLYVNFYLRAVMNRHKSADAGRPIFDEEVYCRVITPGDKNTILDVPANSHYIGRFPKQYEAYKQHATVAQTGTPLEVWPQMTVGMVAELKAMHIHTVEALADLPDNLAQKIMGSHELRRKARAFLEAAKGEAENNRVIEQEKTISELKGQVAQLLAAAQAPILSSTKVEAKK